MSWQSKYNAKFTKQVVRQLVAIIQRDQRAALDFVGGAGVLPDFVGYYVAAAPIKQFPTVLVAPMESQFVPDAVGSLESANRFYVAVGVANQDPQVLADLVQDYIRAVDAILNTVPLPDFYAAIPITLQHSSDTVTQALEAGSLKDLFLVSHTYNEIRQGANGFQMTAVIEVHIHREET